MGATWPRDLNLKGRQLNGIHFAMEFLENWQKKQMGPTHHHQNKDNPELSAKDKNVLIIGGGDTGWVDHNSEGWGKISTSGTYQ